MMHKVQKMVDGYLLLSSPSLMVEALMVSSET
jgi:hypothetical protein